MFCEGLLLSRGGTSLLAATYDPPSPTIYTLTQAPGNQLFHSLFIQSLISFHHVCLFPPFFLISSSLHCWMLLFASNPPPTLEASLSLSFSAPLCIFVFFPLSSPLPLFSSSCSISFTADYLSLSPFLCLPFFSISFSPWSFSVLYSLPSLQLSSPLALFFFFSSPLRPLTLYFPRAFLSPLFSFRSPFLLHSGCQGFVKALSPQWDIQRAKRAEKQTVGPETEGRGSEGRKKEKGGEKGWMETIFVKEMDQMPTYSTNVDFGL